MIRTLLSMAIGATMLACPAHAAPTIPDFLIGEWCSDARDNDPAPLLWNRSHVSWNENTGERGSCVVVTRTAFEHRDEGGDTCWPRKVGPTKTTRAPSGVSSEVVISVRCSGLGAGEQYSAVYYLTRYKHWIKLELVPPVRRNPGIMEYDYDVLNPPR